MSIRTVLIFFLITQTCFGQDVWIQRDSVNGPPRGACTAFTLSNEAFVVTGVNIEENKRKMYSYDLEQDDWDDETALGGETGSGLERSSAIGFSAGGYGFVGLGSGIAPYLNDLWRYDPVTETWSQMADFIGSARRGAIAFSVDHIGFVGLGEDETGLKNDFYRYNPIDNIWAALNDFDGEARKEAVGFTMGGKGYVGTGRGTSAYFSDFWEYNPTTDAWTAKADFPGTPRMGAVGCGVFPSAFIMLGEDNDFEYKEDVWEYHYFGDVWTQRANYAGGTRTQASAMVVGNRIFVGLGYNGVYHDDFYEYEQILSAEEEIYLEIKLYPNPVTTSFEIILPSNYIGSEMRIYSIGGMDVTEDFKIIQDYSTHYKVTRENIPTGYYFVAIKRGDKTIILKKIHLY